MLQCFSGKNTFIYCLSFWGFFLGKTVNKITSIEQNPVSEFIPSVVTCRAASYCCQDLQAVEKLPQFGCCLENLAFRSSSGQTPPPLSRITAVSTVGNSLKCLRCILMVLDVNKHALLLSSVFFRELSSCNSWLWTGEIVTKLWPLLFIGGL